MTTNPENSATYRHALDSGDLRCVPLRVVDIAAAAERRDEHDEEKLERRERRERRGGWVLGEEGESYRVCVLHAAFEDTRQGLVDLKRKIPTLEWKHLAELARHLSSSSRSRGEEVSVIRLLVEKKSWLDEVVGNGSCAPAGSFARYLGVPPAEELLDTSRSPSPSS